MRGSPPGKIALAILAKKPGGEAGGDDGGGDSGGLESAASDLMDAIKGGSPADVAAALKSAFMLMESEPHEEAGE